MPVVRLPGLGVRLRRARRTDLDAVRALLGRPPWPGAQRFDRRYVADLGHDVYVAQDARGEVVGVVAVVYVRSLARGRWRAVLDVLRARERAVGEALLAFAEGRARHRGCRTLETWPESDDDPLVAQVAARGWRAGCAGWATTLEERP